MIDFEEAFKILTEKKPFPWQRELYGKWFSDGKFPSSCNLPTGLGKTSVIAIWFIALMNMPEKMPRRLVYVVNRRTVVDQTTNEVEKLRENLPKLKNVPDHARRLAISTLRGQFADNREWSADPSRPAVICGTVDMIGSRLLFSGYGIGFKSKPLHAGFLGQDVLLVHDEAHLEPAFQELLVAIEKEQWEGERSAQMPWPKLRVMELTATSRGDGADEQKEKSFELTVDEKNPPAVIPDPPTKSIHHVWRRQKAKKALELHEIEDENELAEKVAKLALKHKELGQAVLVFVRKVEDVEKVIKKLSKNSTEQLTGTLRGLERDSLVKKPIFHRFLPQSNRDATVTPAPGTVYLVCTSVGEVGVNISADHMVCDLSTFESMSQRFGRVNRFGDCDDTQIDVVYPKDFGKKDKKRDSAKVSELDQRRTKTLELLKQLTGDASPAALGKLDPTTCHEAFAPPPAILPVTDILFDAWALTTIREKLPGRPLVEPYLHGISEWQPPETHIAWRQEVWELHREFTDDEDRKRFQEFATELLEDYPLKPHELLRDCTFRKISGIRDKLVKLAEKNGDLPVWIQEAGGAVIVTKLFDVADLRLAGRTVILPPEAGGLKITDGVSAGLFDGSDYVPEHRNLYDVADMWGDDKGPLRKRVWQGEDIPSGMTLEREFKFESLVDEDAEPAKVWQWFVRKPEAASERNRIAYPLQPHLDEVKGAARQIVGRLSLPKNITEAVVLAAWFHDLGKHRERWQRSLGNYRYPNEVYAKSGRLPDGTVLRSRKSFKDDYRHEFGSLLDMLDDKHPSHDEFKKLTHEMRELALHLVAAHHGRARPHFPEDEASDLERNGQEVTLLACETPRRFARLQRKYGRWGLAYLESLVRAADYAVSAGLGEAVIDPAKSEN